MTHVVYTDASVPLVVHVVIVDVTSQELYLSATLTGDRGQTVSDWADCKRGTQGCTPVDVAINGDLFTPSGYVPNGLAIGGAKPWPDAASDNASEGWLAYGRPSDVNQVQLSQPAAVEMPASALAVEGAVGGRTLLVSGGMAMSTFDAADPTEPFRSAPRSAIGVDADGPMGAASNLYLVVVDGDQQSSAGMTDEELAGFLVGRGISDALELDGGGSSTLYVRKEGGVVNSPSDGVQRPVANHLGVRFGAQVHFSVVGQVFNTDFGNTAKLITNASVTVDTQTATWNTTAPAHTVYNVNNITPHYVCAHATAPGFMSGTQCREITVQDVQSQGSTQYLSLVLYPGVDPPPDMAKPVDMAMSGPPGSTDMALPIGGADMGPGGGAHSGCDSAAGSVTGVSGFIVALVLFLGAASTFRRRRE
ncbi:MAG TPA: phosphodiester glycosidase family protein [Polyangia bacterium]